MTAVLDRDAKRRSFFLLSFVRFAFLFYVVLLIAQSEQALDLAVGADGDNR